ncbi:MAG: hypothetical protein GXY37_02025 [Chloroflexi bacterium]|nr:hypothetical protein [Chloroflexota bacterium]
MNILSGIADTALVLVAIVPEPRDLDIARLLGWYRVPLKSAPKTISVDYLAFYQGGNFPVDHRWMIETIAELRGHELTTRAELLKDQPNHPRAHEEYFKMQLGPLTALPRPIPTENWKRITFFYTTMQRIKTAEKLKDLPVHDEERPILWRSLREHALRSQEYRAVDLPELPVDPGLLALLGQIGHLN